MNTFICQKGGILSAQVRLQFWASTLYYIIH